MKNSLPWNVVVNPEKPVDEQQTLEGKSRAWLATKAAISEEMLDCIAYVEEEAEAYVRECVRVRPVMRSADYTPIRLLGDGIAQTSTGASSGLCCAP